MRTHFDLCSIPFGLSSSFHRNRWIPNARIIFFPAFCAHFARSSSTESHTFSVLIVIVGRTICALARFRGRRITWNFSSKNFTLYPPLRVALNLQRYFLRISITDDDDDDDASRGRRITVGWLLQIYTYVLRLCEDRPALCFPTIDLRRIPKKKQTNSLVE